VVDYTIYIHINQYNTSFSCLVLFLVPNIHIWQARIPRIPGVKKGLALSRMWYSTISYTWRDCSHKLNWTSMYRLPCWIHNVTLKILSNIEWIMFGDWIWIISGEFLMNGFLWLIPQKFSGNPSLKIPNFRDF